jgi:ssDNA-specific exonuclease RecJ
MEYLENRFSDEELKNISEMAACNYLPSQIALNLDVDKKAFLQTWNNKESYVRLAYERGKLEADFNISNKQRELAEAGNITAAQIFISLREATEIAQIRDQILYGHDDAY